MFSIIRHRAGGQVFRQPGHFSREGGDGYSIVAGLTGSLDGEDKLSLIWETSHAGREAGGRNVTVTTLNYRRYF